MVEKNILKRSPVQKPVYVQVVEQIQANIKQGDLNPGDQLLPERDLAENLGVSRTSVRQALAVLEGKGYLNITPRDGAYIKQRSVEDVVEPLTDALFHERRQADHLFEVRCIIETQAACLAAKRRTQADIARLQDLNRQFAADLAEDISLSFDANMAFHIAIVETAKNPILLEIMATILASTIEVYESAREQSLSVAPNPAQFVEEHNQIIQAIIQQDTQLVTHIISNHISSAQQRVESVIAKENEM